MMKITARPTWQWSGTKPQGAVSLSRPAPARSILPDVKQALKTGNMPRIAALPEDANAKRLGQRGARHATLT